MEISGAIGMAQLCLIIVLGGSFQVQFLFKNQNQPRTMSPNASTGTSVLDEALACIGQRIASILTHPADKDQNSITSLHNEVVGI
jgi:hypothetical protein